MDKVIFEAIATVRTGLINIKDVRMTKGRLLILLCLLVFVSPTCVTLANLMSPLLPTPAHAQPSATTTPSSQNLSNNPGNSTGAQIAVNQNNVYLVWDDATTGNGDIYFKRSVDNGTSFGSTENLSNNPGNSTGAQIAVNQSNVYVLWTDNTTGNGDIYFKRSVDNGTSFGSTENLVLDGTQNVGTNGTGSSSYPQISAVGNNIYVAWTETTTGNSEISFRHSNDTGVTFGRARELSKTISIDGEYALFPHISAIGSNVYVVWQDKVLGNYEIFLRESNDGGGKFSGVKNLSRNNTGDSISPQIVSSGNNVYVVWTDLEQDKSEIFLRASNDNAATFGGLKNISWSNGDSYDPTIAVSGNSSLYVLWEDSSFREFTFDLIFRASENAANTFQDKVNIGRFVGEIADHGEMAVSNNNVFVVWSEAPQYSYPPTYSIFLEASMDNGQSFDDAINLSTGNGSSIEPKIALSEENRTLFVVWNEITNGNSEIQFMKLENFF
jgi:hypothetical protein